MTSLVVEIIFLIVFFCVQCYIGIDTFKKIQVFGRIFPQAKPSVVVDEETGLVSGISIPYSNVTLQSIINAINGYLSNNKGSINDFHLLKDIVDRNTDSAENEIQTQLPLPLYLGLAGTMIGIVCGLWGTHITSDTEILTSANGLLTRVAWAMTISFMGIVITTVNSFLSKREIRNTEAEKHKFLSWMQAELLPELSSDTATALVKMAQNLNNFNHVFERNNVKLQSTLDEIYKTAVTQSQTTNEQARLLETVQRLDITKVALANVTMYDKLLNCSEEISTLGKYLHSANLYVKYIKELTEKLDSAEDKVNMIGEMARFFRDERANLESMKALTAQTLGKTDVALQQATNNLMHSIDQQYVELIKHFEKQRETMQSVAEEQQNALLKRMTELTNLTEELKHLTAVKTSITYLERSIAEQNRKFADLAQSIKILANTKAIGVATTSTNAHSLAEKIIIITAGSTVSVTCLFFLVLKILTFFGIVL